MCCCVGGGLKHKNLVVSSGLINSIQGVNRIEKLISSANHWLKRRPATQTSAFQSFKKVANDFIHSADKT